MKITRNPNDYLILIVGREETCYSCGAKVVIEKQKELRTPEIYYVNSNVNPLTEWIKCLWTCPCCNHPCHATARIKELSSPTASS